MKVLRFELRLFVGILSSLVNFDLKPESPITTIGQRSACSSIPRAWHQFCGPGTAESRVAILGSNPGRIGHFEEEKKKRWSSCSKHMLNRCVGNITSVIIYNLILCFFLDAKGRDGRATAESSGSDCITSHRTSEETKARQC